VGTANDPWGRVADDGTVYVRTADGEREIGSWQAGSPDEALAFFKRKFDALETEISLLEQRMSSTDLSAGQARATITRLTAAVTDAHAIGDLDSLKARLAALADTIEHRREEHKAAREQAKNVAHEAKERIVAEAERLAAEATHWKASGERMRQLLDEWKAAPARNAFAKRRKAYFATLEEEREGIRARKEDLATRAEELSTSTDWGATATAYRELMRAWKQAGRADRGAEDELWARFKSAQDAFFKARSEVQDAKDRELREHVVVKEQLLAEAEKLLPVTDARSTRSQLRGILERWERAGALPRDAQERLEGGLRKIEETVRKAEDSHWRRTNPEALSRARGTVEQIRAAIAQLERQLAKAQASSDQKAQQQAQEAIEARKSWLAEAERTLAELSS
jgi:hypothetical protein